MSVLIVIPTLNLITSDFTVGLMALRYPMNVKSQTMFLKYMTIDDAYNRAVEIALKGNYEYMFILEDDVLIQPDTLQKLYDHHVMVVSGIYHRKQMPSEPLVFKEWGKGTMRDIPENELIQVVGGSFGCSLINTDVFKLMKDRMPLEPIFKTINASNNHKTTQDIYFYKNCEKLGIPIHVDTGVQCGHIDKADNFKIYLGGKSYTKEQQQEIIEKFTRENLL